MADVSPTVGELFKAKAVTDEQLNTAAEAYPANSQASTHSIDDDGSMLDATEARSVCRLHLNEPNLKARRIPRS